MKPKPEAKVTQKTSLRIEKLEAKDAPGFTWSIPRI